MAKNHNQFKLNIPLLDEQHEIQNKLIEELEFLVKNGAPSAAGQAILGVLLVKAEEHFIDEERFMAQNDYPGFHDHRLIHMLLLDNLKDVQSRLSSGALNLGTEIVQLLRAWLMRHIIDSDMLFGEHYAAKNANSLSSNLIAEPSTSVFVWSDDYSIGIDLIDNEHKNIVSILSDLHKSIHERRSLEFSREILDRLVQRTVLHFYDEEMMMEDLSYPGLQEHRTLHKLLIDRIVGLQKKLDAGETKINFELLHFLRVWLIKHVRESDNRFGSYYNNLPPSERQKGKGRNELSINEKGKAKKSLWISW